MIRCLRHFENLIIYFENDRWSKVGGDILEAMVHFWTEKTQQLTESAALKKVLPPGALEFAKTGRSRAVLVRRLRTCGSGFKARMLQHEPDPDPNTESLDELFSNSSLVVASSRSKQKSLGFWAFMRQLRKLVVKGMTRSTLSKKCAIVLYEVRIRAWMIVYAIKIEGYLSTLRGLAEEIIRMGRPRHSDIRTRRAIVTVPLKGIRRIGMPDLGYLAVMQRFGEGLPWEETLYGMSAKRDFLKKGWTRRPEFDSWEAFQKELFKWDLVYEDIRKNGYKQVKNNMSVTRDMIFVDGKHRLAMARLLDLKEITVRIVEI